VEQQPNDTGVTRSQNQLHVVPEDHAAAADVLRPLLDRLEGAEALGAIIVTSDADAAAAIADRLADIPDGPSVMAATEARRAGRVLKQRTPQVLVGPADILAELRGAALKVDAVRLVVLAWVDANPSLEVLLADAPKDAARIVLAADVTPEVEQLVDRYAWRARRVQPAGAEELPGVSLSYVVTSEHGRAGALRRVLDALDPTTAFVVTRDDASRMSVDRSLRALGYGSSSGAVRAGATPEGPTDVVILHDLPARDEELRALVRGQANARVVALVSARQIPALRKLAGGTVSPLSLPDAAVRARSREERLRDEVRAVLEAGQFSREVLTLEPLLANHDGIEVAAALLRVLEAERDRARAPQLKSQPAGGVTRVFLNVGSMDNVRPGDLVGAITNEAGISKDELGRVEVRDKFSTVEVASSVANAVVGKITGIEIRGRRVLAKIDDDKPRERPKRVGGDRGERRGPPRGGARPDRGGRPDRPRSDRPRPTRDRPAR
jgi:ATP-dependent RNA helicase DeaD